MASLKQKKMLGNLVEQKILEFFGDPDAGLELKRSFLLKLRKNMRQKVRTLTSHADVVKKYGLS